MARVLLLTAALSSCWRAASLQAFESPPQAECSHDQVKSFESLRNGTGSLWFFHITHNAGTHILNLLLDNLNQAIVHTTSPLREGDMKPGHFYYDNLFGEEGLDPAPLGGQVPCGSDRFVSVFAVRDPIPRILAGDGSFSTSADAHTDECNSQNYGLRKLIGKKFEVPLTAEDVEFAKRRLDSFDIILDVSTLDDSTMSMCAALEWPRCVLAPASKRGAVTRQDVLEAVGPTVYNKWMKRNAPEIEVYEYAQQLAAEFVRRYPRSPTGAPRRRAEDTLDSDRWFC